MAVAHEMIPVETHAALGTLTGLRKNRGMGKAPRVRQVVPVERVEATLPPLPSSCAVIFPQWGKKIIPRTLV